MENLKNVKHFSFLTILCSFSEKLFIFKNLFWMFLWEIQEGKENLFNWKLF